MSMEIPKVADNPEQLLLAIENKIQTDQELTRDDLFFIYDHSREYPKKGFDERIEDIIDTRDTEADMPAVFECSPEQIAHNVNEIDENTKAYVGEIVELDKNYNLLPEYKNIFQKLSSLEYVYTDFPERRIRTYQVEIGGKTTQELENEILAQGMKITNDARKMLHDPSFATQQEKEQVNLILLPNLNRDFDMFNRKKLGMKIFKIAEEIGLDKCSPETAPYLRLKYSDQPINENLTVAMEPIYLKNQPTSMMFDVGHEVDGYGEDPLVLGSSYIVQEGSQYTSWNRNMAFKLRESKKLDGEVAISKQ